MTNLIAEQPIVLCIALALLAIALLFAWLQSGKNAVGVAGLVVLLLVPVGWFVSERWVTDREQIRRIIRETASAIEANDHQSAVAIIADDQYRKMALAELPRYTFEEARMTGERGIDVNDASFPLVAEADVLVRVKVSGRGFGTITVPRRLILSFEKFGDDWKVMTYRHLPVVGGADGFSPPVVR